MTSRPSPRLERDRARRPRPIAARGIALSSLRGTGERSSPASTRRHGRRPDEATRNATMRGAARMAVNCRDVTTHLPITLGVDRGPPARPADAVVRVRRGHAEDPRAPRGRHDRIDAAGARDRQRRARAARRCSRIWSRRASSRSRRRACSRMNEAARELLGSRSSTSTASAGGWRTRGRRCETFVQTGRPGYAERFGRPWWDDLAAHPSSGRSSTS